MHMLSHLLKNNFFVWSIRCTWLMNITGIIHLCLAGWVSEDLVNAFLKFRFLIDQNFCFFKCKWCFKILIYISSPLSFSNQMKLNFPPPPLPFPFYSLLFYNSLFGWDNGGEQKRTRALVLCSLSHCSQQFG